MRDKAANINQDSINVSYGLINHESDFNLSFNQNMINLNLCLKMQLILLDLV